MITKDDQPHQSKKMQIITTMKNMGIAQHSHQTAKIKETENTKWF